MKTLFFFMQWAYWIYLCSCTRTRYQHYLRLMLKLLHNNTFITVLFSTICTYWTSTLSLTYLFIHSSCDAVLGQLDQRSYSCIYKFGKNIHPFVCKLELRAVGATIGTREVYCDSRSSSPVSLWFCRWHWSWKSLFHTHSSSPPETHTHRRSSTSKHWGHEIQIHTHTHTHTHKHN